MAMTDYQATRYRERQKGTKMRKRIRLLLAVLMFGCGLTPAYAAFNHTETVLAITEVATGSPVVAALANDYNTTGYLIVKTENETAAASLVVTISGSNSVGNVLLCTSSAITANETNVIMIGSLAAAGEGIDDACDFPMTRIVVFTFTVTGAGADFDVTAAIEWVAD